MTKFDYNKATPFMRHSIETLKHAKAARALYRRGIFSEDDFKRVQEAAINACLNSIDCKLLAAEMTPPKQTKITDLWANDALEYAGKAYRAMDCLERE